MKQKGIKRLLPIAASTAYVDLAPSEDALNKWRAPFILAGLVLALNALDILTTHVGLRLGALEANPMLAGLIGVMGEAATFTVKMFVVVIAAALLCKLRRTAALKWLNLAMAAIVVSNFAVLTYNFVG